MRLQKYDRSLQSDALLAEWEKSIRALNLGPEDVIASSAEQLASLIVNYIAFIGMGEQAAHEQLNEITNDMHTYINANWRGFMIRRQEALRRSR